MALDPERVGIENIEVPQICDFGDNVLNYMTNRGSASHNDEEATMPTTDTDSVDDEVEHSDDDMEDDVDTMSTASGSSDESTLENTSVITTLPPKFIAFLKE